MNTKTQNRKFVIIGGVTAGISAARAVKRCDPGIDVIVLEKGEFVSYNNSSLPYYIANVIDDFRQLMPLTPEKAKEKLQIDIRTRHEAMAIVPAKNTVMTLDRETGAEKNLVYDGLLLATGGFPISPPVPGINLPNIFHIRTLTDAINIKQYIAGHTPKKATILGSGYIGLEMAEACSILGMEVTVLEKFGDIMGTLGSEVSDVIEAHLSEHQVSLFKDTNVEAFEDVEGRCGFVVANGKTRRFETDLVIIATGVQPQAVLAKGAGIEIGDTGAIAVDNHAQTSIENIYAAGDCAEVTDLVSRQKTYVPLATTALRQGSVAGKNFANPGCCSFIGSVRTMVTKVFDLEIARTGLSAMDARRMGFRTVTATITANSRASSIPGNQKITITLIVDTISKRLLGAEMGGKEGVSKRIDVFATALHNQMTVHTISQLDLGYAPFYAPPCDPVLVAANAGLKQVNQPVEQSC